MNTDRKAATGGPDDSAASIPGRGLPESLREALGSAPPGRAAQEAMLPAFRRELPDRPPEGEEWRPAAVLILVYREADGFRFPLIERGSSVGRHRGEMGLPGGGLEPGESAFEAALRETREELGLDPSTAAAIELLGALTPLRVPPSGYEISPFVGWLPSPPAFAPEPIEVAALVPAPLGLLLDPGARGREERRFRGRTHEVPFFRLGDRKVWGATAMILAEFAAVLQRGGIR